MSVPASARRAAVLVVLAGVVAVALLTAPASAQSTPVPQPGPSGTPVEPGEGAVAPPGIDLGPPVTDSPAAPDPQPGVVDEEADGGEPGLFDLGGRIEEAINDWFRGLVASALSPALELLGQTVLATPQVTGPGRVSELWGCRRAWPTPSSSCSRWSAGRS